MKFFRELPIKNKIVLIIVAVTGMFLLLAFGIEMVRGYQIYKNEMVERIKLNAGLIAEYCVAPMAFNSIEGVEEILSKLESSPDFLLATIYDSTGALMTSYQKGTEKISLPEFFKDITGKTNKGVAHVSSSIEFDNIKYGNIHLCYTTKRVYNKIYNNMIVLGGIFILLISASLIVALRLQQFISAPILLLAKKMKAISQSNDYSFRIQSNQQDEIGVLYNGFNDMLEQIQIRDDKRNKAETELQKLNDELEKIVEKKIHELQERVEDLERFYDATVDREIRMKELQDRIAELEEKQK
jgi:methyl-accepting chemotaxis protein